MAKRVVSMEVRMRIAVASDDLNVSAFCREHGLSRETFYRWRRRHLAEGPLGLEVRSRAPGSSPQRVGIDVEDAVVALRKDLEGLGVDHGPATIRWHLERQGWPRVPSVATIWRILVRRGFVIPEPRKRPHGAWRRFEASAPNELWQADCTDWPTVGGTARILTFLDDHSRVALAVRALEHATSEATWEVFSEACAVWGVPLGQLSDNGLNFSGKLRGFEVPFEAGLRRIGVVPKTSRPFHPQTCGKVERFQQTMKRWLARRDGPADLTALQAVLDEFVDYYNHQRPHAGIGRITPAERWAQTPPAINLGQALPSPAFVNTSTIDAVGVVPAGRLRIGVGTIWAGRQAVVHHDGTHFAVFIDHQLVRAGTIDPTARYQPLHGHRTRPDLP